MGAHCLRVREVRGAVDYESGSMWRRMKFRFSQRNQDNEEIPCRFYINITLLLASPAIPPFTRPQTNVVPRFWHNRDLRNPKSRFFRGKPGTLPGDIGPTTKKRGRNPGNIVGADPNWLADLEKAGRTG